jgi:hypothetical protein
MDPLRSYLGRLLLEEITPVVMVLTTPLAEAACRKSGLSFVDMLSPFSLLKKIDGDAPPNAWLQIIPCSVCSLFCDLMESVLCLCGCLSSARANGERSAIQAADV